jgi:hypothetical protein
MNYKRIASKLNKMNYEERAKELEALHSVLTINQWCRVYDWLMEMQYKAK